MQQLGERAGTRAAARIEALADRLVALSHEIHAAAELGFAEHESVTAIVRALAPHDVEVGCYGLDTAFRARAGGVGPRVGILAEYDALPGIGHACGHNVIGSAAVGAFLGVAEVVAETGGSVVLYGTPAEENGSGKEIMARAGAFDGLDAVVMLHPGPGDHDVANGRAIGLRSVEATYHGVPAHASARPEAGRNALDAVVAAYQGVAALRQHIPPEDRVHGVITEGGQVANVVPARASLRLLVRSPEVETLVELSRRVQRILQGAAMITETRLDAVWDRIQPCLPIRSNTALATRFQAHMAARGRAVVPDGPRGGSTDLGNVSLRVPAIHPFVAISDADVAPHTEGFAACAVSSRGDRAVVDGAVGLARTAVDVLVDAGLRQQVAAEFAAAGGVVDVPALLGAV
ncbi:M20 family metallopeptidase [Pseudonocardia sp. TRM90224]|uniref:M20 family metallopeptidase n=1 Tax=Pseudonocardia sp. TRM90224 TaxID=2812678 RepID=UPI001E30F531|nr:M20 family metallopeptidase [Pseudonocardia sp. TRM90224]